MKQKIKIKTLFFIFIVFGLLNSQCKKKDKAAHKPVLSSINPTDGIIGDPVSIQGQFLANTDQVTFNGLQSKIIQTSNSTVFTVVPPNAAPGTNNVVIHTDGGTSNELQFTVFKEPDHVDSLPPSLSKALPSKNYTEYPLLLYGDNLSGVVKISFNDKDAVIYTNNKKVITTNVPKDLGAGPVTIKVKTLKGTSTVNFQILGPPPGGPANINFSIVTIPPPNYIPSISNQWSCGLFSTSFGNNSDKHLFVDLNSDTTGNGDYAITGRYEYDFNKSANYNDLNYVEVINHSTQDTLVGQFSSKFNNPCVLNMILLSSKSGQIFNCIFDLKASFPDVQCDQ